MTTVRLILFDLDADADNWKRVRQPAPDIASVTCAPRDFDPVRHLDGEAKTVALIHRVAGYATIRKTAVTIRECGGGVIVVGEGAETVQDTVSALSAGAHGYVGSNRPVEQLIVAIRAVAADYLFAPVEQLPSIAEKTLIFPSHKHPALEGNELTQREFDVLSNMARGDSNAEIGKTLFISESTVRTHVLAILRKFGARNRTEAVVLASQKGIRLNER